MSGGKRMVLVASLVLAWFATLGARPLYKADESRYAEISREMVASGDWVTPRLNGFKYFEKPPLQYWATATAFALFGFSDWAARLWTTLLAIFGLVIVLWAGNRLFERPTGDYAATVLASCPLYVLLGRINTLDMSVSVALAGAVIAFSLAQRDEASERQRGRWMLVFWAACALAVLSKGLIGILLPAAVVGFYVAVKRDWRLLWRLRLLAGGALFLAIAAPWFVAVSLANAEFAHFFFVQEHFQRFTTRMHGRYQPVWYFLPILAFGLSPWLLPFGYAVKRIAASRPAARFDPQLFLALWIVVVLVFFSASSSKLPSYILPVFPAVALLVGRWLALEPLRPLVALQAALTALAGIALAAATPWIMNRLGPEPAQYAAGYAPFLVAAGVILATGATGAAVLAWRGQQMGAVALLALGSLLCTLTALVGHHELSPAYSIAEQVEALDPPVPQEAAVFAVDFYDHTIPWYLRRTVTMVRYKDELGEAIKWEPHKFIAELAGFARAWRDAPAAYAVFPSAKYEELSAEIRVPMQVVSRGPRYTIVRKP